MADHALIGAVHRAERIPEKRRINPQKIVEYIEKAGKQANSFISNLEMGDFLNLKVNDSTKEKLLVVFFSNGSFDGVIQNFVNQCQKETG